MFTRDQLEMIKKAADGIQVELEKCLAFMQVESGNQVYATVGGRNEPLIRWEGHYFYKLVPAKLLQKAIAIGLANKTVGGVKNPASQVGRYEYLERGKQLDYAAAVSSASWGIGQVMGSHWEWLGLPSAKSFEQTVRSGFSGQLKVMFLFLEKSGIIPHLRRGDWSAVARIYNGPKYANGKYHIKMKDAYASIKGSAEAVMDTIVPSSAGMLRSGSKGKEVRELQQLLSRAGFGVKVDGDFGPSTERAVKVWQKNNGLEVDGVAGKETLRTLQRLKVDEAEVLGIQPSLENTKVKNGLITGVGGAGLLVTAKETVDSAITQISGIAGGPIIENVGAVLAAASACLAIGGLAYAAYGWWTKDKNYKGIEAELA